MAPLESFQSRSFRFSLQILRLYRRIVALAPVPQHILNQFLRAGTAIGSNLEEAKAAHSKRDLAAKQVIALREARECRYWLRLVLADQPKLAPEVEPLLDESDQIIAILTVSVRKLRATFAVLVTGAVLAVVLAARVIFHGAF